MDIKLYKIIVTPTAYKEIKNIYQYISEDLYAEKSAIKLMKKIEEKIMQLKINPKMYSKVKISTKLKRQYRKIIINKYVILYTIDDIEKIVYISHMYYIGKNYI